MIFFFGKFTLSSYVFAKFSSSINVSVNKFFNPSSIIVVSLANCTNLNSVLLILIPFFSLLFIFIDNISAQRIKKNYLSLDLLVCNCVPAEMAKRSYQPDLL